MNWNMLNKFLDWILGTFKPSFFATINIIVVNILVVNLCSLVYESEVKSLSHVQLLVTPWTAA